MPKYDVFERQAQLKVYADGRYLAALQQGLYRPYVFPVRTVQGHVVTQAGPADHPHHLSIWLGHASVNGLNFWAPETLGISPAEDSRARHADRYLGPTESRSTSASSGSTAPAAWCCESGVERACASGQATWPWTWSPPSPRRTPR